MRTTTDKHGDAYQAVRYIYDRSPGRSWRRLNGALHNALEAAIIGQLSFLPDDFAAISEDMNGGYWMGNSSGSVCGERYYLLAVSAGHTPACISFERYARRPAALWAEDVKTPARLCIGSEFTWKGKKLSVTNFRSDHLIACSYAAGSYSDKLVEGSGTWISGKYRTIERVNKSAKGGLLLRLSEPLPEPSRKPVHVVTIPYAELAQVRKEYDARRRQALADIAATESAQDLEQIRERLASEPRHNFRHFDIEDFRKAIQERERSFGEREAAKVRQTREAAALDRWVAGDGAGSYFSEVRLRIKGPYVETSTGHSVTLESARAALPLVLARRRRPGPIDGRIDLYDLKSIQRDGVLIGCTLVPWGEIDRLAPMLQEQVCHA